MISKRFHHYVFGVIQSGLTSGIASAIASLSSNTFLTHWLWSWLLSWVLMLPIVLFAAPYIRKLADALTHDAASRKIT